MPRTKPPIVLETKLRIPRDEYYYVIVPNVAAGKPRRYTVWRIAPNEGDNCIGVVGSEVPLSQARELTRSRGGIRLYEEKQ